MNDKSTVDPLVVDFEEDLKRAYKRHFMQSKKAVAPRPDKPEHPPFNRLMWRGDPLPEKWHGAEYRRVERRNLDTHWELLFHSDYSEDILSVFLDIETVSGAEATKLGATFLEVINQRRLG